MPTAIIRPNLDGATTQFIPDTGTEHFSRVNEAVTQPTLPSGGGFLSMSSGPPKVEILGMETIAGVSSVSQFRVWVYSSFTSTGPTFVGSVFMAGAFVADVSFGAAAAAGWYSAVFNGSWGQADLDAVQVRMTFTSGSPQGTLTRMYAEVTYEVTDVTAPTLSNGTIHESGTTLTATLSESGCVPASGTGGFAVSLASGRKVTAPSWTISGTMLTVSLSRTVYQTDVVEMRYSRTSTADDIQNAAGNFLADFAGAAVTNNSAQTAPIAVVESMPPVSVFRHR